MKHNFPTIRHINDVLPYLIGFEEFKHKIKDGYQVILYKIQIPGSFGNTETLDITDGELIRRECRGITFDLDGNIIGRKFNKFFNVGERLETMMSNVDLSKPHVILEKLDGSMITPMFIENELQWHTKAGDTSIGKMAGDYVKKTKKINYEKFSAYCKEINCTAIFEYCSRKNRVVLDYPEDKLILTAIRENYTGYYIKYDNMVKTASKYNIPVVKVYKSDDSSIEVLLKEISEKTGIEGVVLRFNNGHMCKIKCAEYILFHKVLSDIEQEKNIWRLVAENKLDDIKPSLPNDIKKDIDKFESVLQKQIIRVNKEICDTILNWVENNKTIASKTELKKKFAQEVISKVDKRLIPTYFNIRNYALPPYGMANSKTIDIIEPDNAIAEFIIKNSSTNPKIEKMRSLFNNIKLSLSGVENQE